MLNLLIIGTNIKYPNGLAGASFLGVFTKVLLKNGVRTKIFIISAVEIPGKVLNKDPRGIYEGIEYEYTSGTTIRHPNIFIRNLTKLFSVVNCLWKIFVLRNNKALDVVYVYSPYNWQDFFIIQICQFLKIPVSIFLCEWWPVIVKNRSFLWENRFYSMFKKIDGVITLTEFLKIKAQKLVAENPKQIEIIKIIPAVESPNSIYYDQCQLDHDFSNTFLWCGNVDNYKDLLKFIFRALKVMEEEDCFIDLCIFGGYSDAVKIELSRYIEEIGLNKFSVGFMGFVKREYLAKACMGSKGFLLPLMNNVRDEARFPIKLGEYLSFGKPVVISNHGECCKFLVDRENAILCEPENERSFAQGIQYVIENPKEAHRIGEAGKELFADYFDFEKNQADGIVQFFMKISNKT